ncbi:MAG: flippase-like domain-containing protein, partial [Candidatus Altiarchaeota archaeon]|nr:flippase-like domain-containing protein [Candidatus Altiarchaeota archaeon]
MYRKRILLFLIGFTLLLSYIVNIDFVELSLVFSRLSLNSILILLGLQFLVFFLMSMRWYVIIRRYGASLWNVVRTSFIGFMVNNLTPVTYAGGEPVRALIISRIDKVKAEKAFATVLVDLFLSLIPAILLMFVALILVFKNSLDIRFAWLLGIIAFLLAALLVASTGLLLNRGPSLRLFKGALNIFARIKCIRRHVLIVESKVDELFASFHKSIKLSATSTSTTFPCLAISSLVWIFTLARVYLTFAFLGYSIDPEVVVIVYAILVTVSFMPFLPGALGLWEWVGTGIFTYFGVPLSVSVAFVIIDRDLFYWLP